MRGWSVAKRIQRWVVRDQNDVRSDGCNRIAAAGRSFHDVDKTTVNEFVE